MCNCRKLNILKGLTDVTLHASQFTYNCRGIIYHPATYCWEVRENNTHIPEEFRKLNAGEIKQVNSIQQLLTLPINSGDDTLNDSQLHTRLLSKNLGPLKFISYGLSLRKNFRGEHNVLVSAKTKKNIL
jgi:hypothetical protein